MIHLKNIRLVEGILYLNYRIDYSDGEYGYIEYDVKTKECRKVIYSEAEKDRKLKMWFGKTMIILQMHEWDKNVPEETYYYWF